MRGARTIDPKLATTIPLESFIPQIAAYVLGERATISNDGSSELSIPQLCTFLDALIAQMPKNLRKGRFEKILAATRSATELCFAAHIADTEKLELLELMLQRQHISQHIYDGWRQSIQESAKQHHRDTAGIIVHFYQSAFDPALRERPKHRPRGSESRATEKFDDAVIEATILIVRGQHETPHGTVTGWTLPDVEAKLRAQVRTALEKEPLLKRGDGGAKSNLDTHHKRILRKLRAMHEAADKNEN